MCIRDSPEALRLTPPGQGPQGEVVAREFKGHDLTYRVRLHGVQPEREVLVQEGPTCPFKVGDRVGLEVVGEGVALEGTPPAPVRQEA